MPLSGGILKMKMMFGFVLPVGKKLKNDEVKGEGYILNSILYSLFYGFCDF